MLRISSPENDITSDIALEITAAIATPASSNVATCTDGPMRASRNTANAVTTAPTNAAAGTPNVPKAPAPTVTITMMAPSAAPEDTPMIAGSASGFRNNPWNTIPDVASAAPTTAASTTLGNRSWNTITSLERGTPSG